MSHFTQMAMHSMYYPIVCFSCLIRILGACSISVDRRPTHCSLWRCDLVFFWLNQSSPMYGYLRCFQSFLIRNCAAIITFKCIHFALEKINMNKIPRVKDVAKWKDMCTWDFAKFFFHRGILMSLPISSTWECWFSHIQHALQFNVLSDLLMFSNLTNAKG